MIDDEVKRAARLLETMMKMAGVNRQELDQRMDAGRGYSSQVLSGRMELKYRHILAMLAALDVEPATFFGILYPPREELLGGGTSMERLLGQLRRISPVERASERPEPAAAAAGAPGVAVAPDDLDRRIRAVVKEMLGDQPARARSGKKTRSSE